MNKDLLNDLEKARFLTRLLDTRFKLLGVSFGIDPILNFIPGFGNLIGTFTSLYLILIALKVNLPSTIIVKMIANIAIDSLLGVIPAAGIVADLFYRANYKNLKLMEDFINKK